MPEIPNPMAGANDNYRMERGAGQAARGSQPALYESGTSQPANPAIPNPARPRKGFGLNPVGSAQPVDPPVGIFNPDENARNLSGAQALENQYKVNQANKWWIDKQNSLAPSPAPPNPSASYGSPTLDKPLIGQAGNFAPVRDPLAGAGPKNPATPLVIPSAAIPNPSAPANDAIPNPSSRGTSAPGDRSLDTKDAQGQDRHLLPGMGILKGSELDRLGEQMGVPRGTSSLNGAKSRMEDGVYAHVLRQAAIDSPEHQQALANDPQFQSLHATAAAHGIPASSAGDPKAAEDQYASLKPKDRVAAMQNQQKIDNAKTSHEQQITQAQKKLEAASANATTATIGKTVTSFLSNAGKAVLGWFKSTSATAKTKADQEKVAMGAWQKADTIRAHISDPKTWRTSKGVNLDEDGSQQKEALKKHDEYYQGILPSRPAAPTQRLGLPGGGPTGGTATSAATQPSAPKYAATATHADGRKMGFNPTTNAWEAITQ